MVWGCKLHELIEPFEFQPTLTPSQTSSLPCVPKLSINNWPPYASSPRQINQLASRPNLSMRSTTQPVRAWTGCHIHLLPILEHSTITWSDMDSLIRSPQIGVHAQDSFRWRFSNYLLIYPRFNELKSNCLLSPITTTLVQPNLSSNLKPRSNYLYNTHIFHSHLSKTIQTREPKSNQSSNSHQNPISSRISTTSPEL